MISVPCPRCTDQFKEWARDEDAIGTVDYQVSDENLEPTSHGCSYGHVLTTAEWVLADLAASNAVLDEKYNR